MEKNTEEIMYRYANKVKQISNIPLDVHLMTEDVKKHIDEYLDLEPSTIIIHYEACKENILSLINYIKEHGIKPRNGSIANYKC